MDLLLVDDNFPFPDVFRDLLGRHGVRVRHCTDAESALRAAGERRPDLLMIEENLGSFSGLLLVRLMKIDVPVIATSIVPPDELLRRDLHALGIDAFLLKPFAHCQVIPQILRLLGRDPAREGLAA